MSLHLQSARAGLTRLPTTACAIPAIKERKFAGQSAFANGEKAKPIRYPSFEEWKSLAANCDSRARLSPEERLVHSSSKRVDPGTLASTVSQFVDWEAFAYWGRPALEHRPDIPAEVLRELRQRCPGYLKDLTNYPKRQDPLQSWDHLLIWIVDHFFDDARKGGWFGAVLSEVRNHPRAIRTMEFAAHCDEIRKAEVPIPYPLLETWLQAADAYIQTDETVASANVLKYRVVL